MLDAIHTWSICRDEMIFVDWLALQEDVIFETEYLLDNFLEKLKRHYQRSTIEHPLVIKSVATYEHDSGC